MTSPYSTAMKLAEAVLEIDRRDPSFARKYGLWALIRNHESALVARQIEDSEFDADGDGDNT